MGLNSWSFVVNYHIWSILFAFTNMN